MLHKIECLIAVLIVNLALAGNFRLLQANVQNFTHLWEYHLLACNAENTAELNYAGINN